MTSCVYVRRRGVVGKREDLETAACCFRSDAQLPGPE